MKRFTILFLVLCSVFSISVFAKKKNSNPTILTINGHEVSKDEFLRLYKKNNMNMLEGAEKKTIDEYLQLYIDFKLKVVEAEAEGLDTIKSFVDELAGYRKDLAKPYLTDISFEEKMIEEAYRNSYNEVNANHILIMCKPEASPSDTLKAWNKAIEARGKFLDGADWDSVAVNYSEEPRIEQSKGKLGYFAGFQMVYPFEKAAFNAEVGKVTMPVRTRFGYHLILVNDNRPALGQIKVAHIMKMFKPNMTEEQKIGLKDSIDKIYEKVVAGDDFAALASEYSDDKRSAGNGGEMQWFDRHTFKITDFTDPAYALEKNGDYSEPIRTDFGWHIIQRIDFKPSPTIDEVRKELEKKVKEDPQRSKHSEKAFISKMKKKYDFTEDTTANKVFYSLAKNYVTDNKSWDSVPDSVDLTKTLFAFDNKSITQTDFIDYLKSKKTNNANVAFIDKSYEEFVDKTILEYEDSNLEKMYPEFRFLVNEYHDGILLFNITDKMVWGKAVKDSVGLQHFYDLAHDTLQKGEEFIWGDRFKGKIYRCKSEEDIQKLEELLNKNVEDEDIQVALNAENKSNSVKIENGAWEEGANPIIDYFIYNGKKPSKENVDFIKVTGEPIGPQPKTLEDARGIYISEYQNYLEREWINKLRKKHTVDVNKKVLKRVRKEVSKLEK